MERASGRPRRHAGQGVWHVTLDTLILHGVMGAALFVFTLRWRVLITFFGRPKGNAQNVIWSLLKDGIAPG